MSNLSGRTILITDSSQGMGAATARLAVERGAQVILHGRTESDHLRALSEEIGAPYIAADVTDYAAMARAVEAEIGKTGRIDGLVNCVGIVGFGPLETPMEECQKFFATNIFGVVNVCQTVVPHMKGRDSGSIVNLISTRGLPHMPSPRSMPYCSSKAALLNFTTALAKAFAPTIRVNAITPGFVLTEKAKGKWDEKSWTNARAVLMGRPAEPREIARAILFLLSDGASFITGQNLIVDGGQTIGL